MQSAPSNNAPCPCGSGKKYKRCCGPGSGRHAPADKFQQVIKLYLQGNLPAAEHLAGQLLRSSPNEPALIEISAVIALQLGKVEQAIEQFRRQLKLQPANALAHSNLCMALHSLNRDEEAFQHGQQAINLDPGLADAWNNLGNIYKSGNNLEKALTHYEKALELNDSDPRVHVNAGSVSQLLGDLDKAEQRYRSALKIHPDFAAALNNLATVLQRQDRKDEADAVFRQALTLEPDNPETLTNYGTFLLDQDNTDKAREYFQKAIQSNPDYAGAYVCMGNLSDRLNDYAGVSKYYDKALLLDPNNTTVHCNIGYRLFERGDQKEAVDHFISALKSDPHSAKGLAGLGKAMLRQDKDDKAVEYIEKALKLAPRDIHAHMAKAHLDAKQRRLESAASEWKYIIAQRPRIGDGYIGLAKHYSDLGRYDDARAQLQRAEDIGVNTLHLYHEWSTLEEKLHNLDEAERFAQKAADINPSYPGPAILKAKLARRRKDFETALMHLEQIDSDSIEDKQTRSIYLFELGSVLDKLGRYPEAFAAYDAANQTKNHYLGRVYEPDRDQQQFTGRKIIFSKENWQQLGKLSTPLDTNRPCPVFIVGFPRSGTSLLEQVLGSHPQIIPAGELTFISELTNYKAAEITGSEQPYPDLLLDPQAPLDKQKLQAMRDYYLSSVESLGITDNTTRWVTDKMPHNALHVGLLALLFPEAPIIHISRHPLNSCLSAYFSNFMSTHRYTSSLESTAQHYNQVMGMLEHYRTIGISFLEVHYEDLVEDQEKITRQILEYIGAPWDDACLQHYKSTRVVKTASYEQVTQKIYTSSLYRYRNYREAVQPIIPILESTIAHFGYTTD